MCDGGRFNSRLRLETPEEDLSDLASGPTSSAYHVYRIHKEAFERFSFTLPPFGFHPWAHKSTVCSALPLPRPEAVGDGEDLRDRSRSRRACALAAWSLGLQAKYRPVSITNAMNR